MRKIILLSILLLIPLVSFGAIQHLNPEYRILRYMWKVQTIGLTTAHLKAMKAEGDDYQDLYRVKDAPPEIRNTVNQRIPVDGVIEYEKLKDVFVSKGLMTEQEFDDAVASLRNAGLLEDNSLTLTGKGIQEFEAYESGKSWLPEPTATSTIGAESGLATKTGIFAVLAAIFAVFLGWAGYKKFKK